MLRLYSYQSPKKASILVVCLWTLAVLSILGMGLSSFVFQEIRFASSFWRLSFSLPIASAATKAVFYQRDADYTLAYDTLEELSSEDVVSLCDGAGYKYYFVDKISKDNDSQVIDEGALVNINTVSPEVLKKLPGISEDLADKIVNGGYRPYSSINEVLLVEGMDKDTFKLFKDYITVYGSGKININTAAKPVLIAIGLDEDLADIILRFRLEHEIQEPEDLEDELEDREVEHGFSNAASIMDDLRKSSMLSLRQEQDLLSLSNVLDVKSAYLRFNIIPVAGKKQGINYSITICPATKKILSWREY